MNIKYLNTDLEIESQQDVSRIVEEFGDDVTVLFQGIVRSNYHFASFEVPGSFHEPDEVMNQFCLLVENLPVDARLLWDNCVSRIFDIGYESGDSPEAYRSELRPSTVQRVASIGASIFITIYPVANDKK